MTQPIETVVLEFARLDRSSLAAALPPDERPEKLWIRGQLGAHALLERMTERGLAIVGTRAPQSRSTQLLKRWIESLRDLDVILISGLARGIDSEAHRAALRAGLPTVAIIGSGLDSLYPPDNRHLAQEILDSGGLILSEQVPLAPAKGFHFLRRNRLLAAWSRCVCVIEAPARSGTLNTARWARDFDRPVFAVPCFPGDSAFLGNQHLLEKQEAIPFWGPDDLGLIWNEIPSHLALQRTSRGKSCKKPPFSEKARLLSLEVAARTSARGGGEILSLLDWALSRNWLPSEFYGALQELLDSNDLRESQGVLLKNESQEV